MNTVEQLTSRELEIHQVRNAITRTAAEIARVEGVLAQMREKQIARHRELVRQETLARCSNAELADRSERFGSAICSDATVKKPQTKD